MKNLSGSFLIASLSLLVLAPAHAQGNAGEQYLFSVSRMNGYLVTQTLIHQSCEKRFPEQGYDGNAYLGWVTRNGPVISEVRAHVSQLPALLARDGVSTAEEIREANEAALAAALAPVAEVFKTAPVNTASRLCTGASGAFSDETQDMERKYANELVILRGCKEAGVCGQK